MTAAFVVPPATVAAQGVLTLEQATAEALSRNPALRAAVAGAAEQVEHVSAARAGRWPRVSVSEGWQRGNQPVFVFGSLLAARRFTADDFAIDSLNRPEARNFHRSAVDVSQPLFDAQQEAQVQRARITADLSSLDVEAARTALTVRVAETYGRIVAADAMHRALTAAMEAARADRTRAADRRDAGVVTDADVLALDAHVASLTQRAVRAEGEGLAARATLNQLMGAPIDRRFDVVGAADPAVAVDPSQLSAYLAEAAAARAEVRRAATLQRLAASEHRLARAALLPRVNAHAGVEVAGLRFDQRTTSWLLGADVTWQFSVGGSERARLQAAGHARSRAAAEADAIRAAVELEVVTALTEYRSAAERRRAGSAAVAYAQESERIVRDRYEAGLATVTDLLRAQAAGIDAEAQQTASTVEAMVTATKLARALGRP